jgi:purine-binding chemotaxis protein CheW
MRNTYRVLPMEALATVPGMPPLFKGTVTARGKHVPVLDLRAKLGLQMTGQSAEGRIVIVNTVGHDIGFIVDAVAGVSPVLKSSIESAEMSRVRDNYLSGKTVLGSHQVFLLDIDRVCSIFKDDMPATPKSREPTSVR